MLSYQNHNSNYYLIPQAKQWRNLTKLKGALNMTTQENSLIKIDRVKELTGLSTTTIYEHVKKGIFPQPKKCGRATRWRLADVLNYINA